MAGLQTQFGFWLLDSHGSVAKQANFAVHHAFVKGHENHEGFQEAARCCSFCFQEARGIIEILIWANRLTNFLGSEICTKSSRGPLGHRGLRLWVNNRRLGQTIKKKNTAEMKKGRHIPQYEGGSQRPDYHSGTTPRISAILY